QEKIIKISDFLAHLNDKIKTLINLYKKQLTYLIYRYTNNKSKYKLKTLCDLKRGYSFKNYTKSGYKIIKISNIQNGHIEFLDKDDNIPNLNNKFILNKDDFIVALVGSNVGKIGLYNKQDIVMFNNGVAKFTNFNLQYIFPKYLYYYLRQNEKMINNKAHGTCQPNVTPKDILSLNIPLISKGEQQSLILYCDKIVTLVDKLDKNVKFNEQKAKLIVQKELK
ncbi:MAG: restriction endonuclease subunit S, partial [Candidatus Micrarchaeaceae archaeon]